MHYLDKTASLTPLIRRVICDKATEHPFSGVYNTLQVSGTYLCRRCGLALFRGSNQFHSSCGWPSFDEEMVNNVRREQDEDGERTEILCARCNAHLGHVFSGEFLTNKNLRHCVNSAALDFVTSNTVVDTEEAIVAGGCFWGVEYFLKKIPGVLKVESGYTGGFVNDPSYQQICNGDTGHYEAVRVLYDYTICSYEEVLRGFFEIHDPTQSNGQGPDLGFQYQSAIFYYSDEQKQQALELIRILKLKHFNVVTKLIAAQVFWPAENYHQDYYAKNLKTPYCHRPVKRFD